MADYTNIDKLRELAEAATPGPWHFAYCGIYADAKVQTEENWWTEERMNDGHTYDHRAGEACPACGPRMFQHTDGAMGQMWDCALAGDALDQEALVARVRPSYGDTATGRRRTDAEFIAACSPDVILALAAELVGLRTEVDQLRGENGELRENVVHMESERTGKCLACGEDWTCDGYYADIAHEARVENLITAERDALQARIDATEGALRSVLDVGRTSGTNLNAWNEAFDIIVAALGVDPQKEDGTK